MGAILDKKEGERIVGFFLIKDVDWKKASNGSDYANFLLERYLENIPARLWDATSEQKQQFKRKSVVKIEGSMTSYRGNKQVNIHRIRPIVPEDQVNVTELISKEGVQREKLWQDLRTFVEEIESKNLKSIVSQVFNQKVIRERLTTIPATKSFHHTYYAGLLDHIVHLTKSTLSLLPLYPLVNKDIILATSLLHEIGKTKLFTEAVAPEYTTVGELLGHLALTMEIVNEAAEVNDIPLHDEELLSLKHCIASQLGEVGNGYGSLVSPKTAEAIFFHYVKEMNIKLQVFEMTKARSQEDWSYSPGFKRRMFTKKNEEE